ncbi:MAG: radical SAM protein [Clostridiales bacterium]|nr:radical SAM protein [Clostridiales bacterium]
MLIKFKNLMLEVTRKCNMRCAHCMRGEQQDETMPTDTIQKLFEYVSEIEQLSITGGEPSLAPEPIRWIAYFAKSYSIKIGSFFCATNAGEYSKEFVDALNGLYTVCTAPDKCILTISTDQYHSEADPKALSEYRKLSYYSTEKEKGFLPKGNILLEGRAAENNLGRFSKPFTEHIYDFDMHGWNMHIGDRIYINALGDVLLDPDLSYLNQTDENIGNIWQSPFDQILIESFYKLPEQYLPENNQRYVYCVHIASEANTITIKPNESRVYYLSPLKAVSAYQSVLNNLRITPVYSKDGRIPDDLDMKFGELPEIEDRCAGTEIRYLLPGATPKTVIVEIFRCPIEEDYDDVRK